MPAYQTGGTTGLAILGGGTNNVGGASVVQDQAIITVTFTAVTSYVKISVTVNANAASTTSAADLYAICNGTALNIYRATYGGANGFFVAGVTPGTTYNAVLSARVAQTLYANCGLLVEG